MVIQYDRNSTLTTDQKLESLLTSIQLAFNEVQDELRKKDREIAELKAAIEAVNGD